MADWLDEYKAGLQGDTATLKPAGETDWLDDFNASLQPEPEGKIGFVENIKRGGVSGFLDKASLGVKPLFDAAILSDRVKRFRTGDYERTEAGWQERQKDEKKIGEYLQEQAEVAERGKTVGAKVGGIVGDMLPFMAEFVLTGGMSALGKKAVSSTVRRTIFNIVGKKGAESLGAKAAGSLAGWVTAAGIRTALTPHRSLTDFIERRMPDIQISPEGQKIFTDAKDSPFRSAYKAIGNQFIEMASEEAGAFLGVVGGKVATKLLPKKAVAAFARLKNAWVSGGTGRTAKQFAQKMASKAGFNGVLEEFSEERLGAIMRLGAGIDEGEGTTFEKIGRAFWPGAEQAFVELIAFSVPGVARGVAAQIFENRPAKKTYSRSDMRKMGITQKTTAEFRKAKFERDKAEFEAEQEPETPVEAEVPAEQEVPVEVEIAPQPVAEEVETAPEPVAEPELSPIEADLKRQAEIDEAEKTEVPDKGEAEVSERIKPTGDVVGGTAKSKVDEVTKLAAEPDAKVQKVGTVSDFLITEESRKEFEDVLDVEVWITPANKGREMASYEGAAKQIWMRPNAIQKFIATHSFGEHFFHEVIHAKHHSKQRQTDRTGEYVRRPHEVSARKGSIFWSNKAKQTVTPSKGKQTVEAAEGVEKTLTKNQEVNEVEKELPEIIPNKAWVSKNTIPSQRPWRVNVAGPEGDGLYHIAFGTEAEAKEHIKKKVKLGWYVDAQVEATPAKPSKGKAKKPVAAKKTVSKPEILQKIPKDIKDQALKDVESDPVFEIEDEAQDVRGRQIDVGVFHVPENLKGEVDKAIEDDPSLQFNITHEKGKGTPYDQAVAEGLLERTGGTAGTMDIGEFLKRLSESKRARRKVGGVSEAVLDKMIASGDPFSEINAVKHTMLNSGFTIEEVNEAVESISQEHDIEFEPISVTEKETKDVKESGRIPEKAQGKKKPSKGKKQGQKVEIKTDLLGNKIHPSEVAVPSKTPKQGDLFGSKNKGVTREQIEKDNAAIQAEAPLRGKQGKGLRKGQVRTFNKEDFARAARFAAFYFEGGLREIQAFSAQMIKTMGEAARPHLQKLFAEAKKTVEAAESTAQVQKPEPTKKPVSEQPTGKTAAEPELSEANTAKEVDDSLDGLLSAKNISQAEVREDLGLGEVASHQRKSQQVSVDNAIRKGLPEQAAGLAAEVIENPRLLNDEQQAGLLVRSMQLRDQYLTAKKKHPKASEADQRLLEAEMNRLEAEFDSISQALKIAGTQIGRALAFRRNYIDESYDVLSVKTRARAAKGSELTDKQAEQIEKLTTELEQTNETLDEKNARIDELIAEQFVKGAKKPKKGKRTTTKRTSDIAKMGAEINQLLKEGCV